MINPKRMIPRSDYRAKLWPHGEFASWQARRVKSLGKVRRLVEAAPGSPSSMGSSTVTKNRNDDSGAENPGTARNWGITSYMKKLLRSAGEVLERKHGRDAMAFITTTMPYSKPDDVRRFLIEWPEIQRRFLEEITRQLVRAGLSPEICWVTELQGLRGQRYGYPCPHLHILLNGRHPSGTWALSKDWVRQTWYRVVRNAVQVDFDPSAATRIESVRKSCAAYMTKYVTKAKASETKKWEGTEWEPFLPKRWGRVTNTLRREVLQAIEMLIGEGGLAFSMDLQGLQADGQVYIVFSEYGCSSGYIVDKQTFDDIWQYYRLLDSASYTEFRERQQQLRI